MRSRQNNKEIENISLNKFKRSLMHPFWLTKDIPFVNLTKPLKEQNVGELVLNKKKELLFSDRHKTFRLKSSLCFVINVFIVLFDLG